LITLAPSCVGCLEIHNHQYPGTLRPVLTCNAIALPLPLDRTIKIFPISMLYGSAGIGLRVHWYSVYRRMCLREVGVAEFGG